MNIRRLERSFIFVLQAPGLGLLEIEPELSKSGRLLRVRSRMQIAFLQKVAPTRASVFLGLTPFEIVERSLRALGSFNHGHNPTGFVGPLVEPNDRE